MYEAQQLVSLVKVAPPSVERYRPFHLVLSHRSPERPGAAASWNWLSPAGSPLAPLVKVRPPSVLANRVPVSVSYA